MSTKDVVLSINVVEPPLVEAVKKLSQELGVELKGLMLVDKHYAGHESRPKDTTGLFEEVVCDFKNHDELQLALKPYLDRILVATVRYESAIQPFRKVIPFIPYVLTPTETSLVWATEKPLMRARMAAYDQHLVPRHQYLEQQDLPKLNELIDGFTYPMIVKPAALAEALLVTRCDDEPALRACLGHTFTVIQDIYDREHRHNKPGLLIEEMMQGPMYSTDAYVTAEGEVFCLPLVRVITAHEIGLPGFYSYRHIIPTDLPDDEIQEAFRVSEASIKALNLRATTTHIELFRTPDGWKIIEVGARIGGYRNDLYREAYGVDHFYNDLCVRMGKKPTMPGEPIRHAAGINIYADEEGVIASIEGVDEACKLSSIVYLSEHAKAGDEAVFANKGGQLIVDGILSNADKEQLEKDVAKVRELVKINIEKAA
jgi:biotin carboxylase